MSTQLNSTHGVKGGVKSGVKSGVNGTLNIKKFAALCNLSVGTVSGIINKKPGFKEETIAFVHAQMHKHKYRPNPYAQKMQKRTLQSIGIICDSNLGFFKSYIIKELIQYLSEKSYNSFVHYIHDHDDEIFDPLSIAVDSYIIMGLFPRVTQRISDQGLQAILLDVFETAQLQTDSSLSHTSIHHLYFDRKQSHKNIVNYFQERGHQHFGFIGKLHNPKYNDYTHALNDAGHQLHHIADNSDSKNIQNIQKVLKGIKKNGLHVAFFIPFEGDVLQFALQCELLQLKIGIDVSAITWGMNYGDLLPSVHFTRAGAFSKHIGADIFKKLQAPMPKKGKHLALTADIYEGCSVRDLRTLP